MRDVLIATFGGGAVVGALGVVLSQRPSRSVLFLVVSLASLAACYLVLTAEFVAWVQLLLYVGAVVVLLVFATMMSTHPLRSAVRDRPRWPAAAVSGVAFAGLMALVTYAFRWDFIEVDNSAVGTAKRLGEVIFTEHVLAFELLSILLLAALVGAIVLTRGRERA